MRVSKSPGQMKSGLCSHMESINDGVPARCHEQQRAKVENMRGGKAVPHSESDFREMPPALA